jgi:hypothetical protein
LICTIGGSAAIILKRNGFEPAPERKRKTTWNGLVPEPGSHVEKIAKLVIICFISGELLTVKLKARK